MTSLVTSSSPVYYTAQQVVNTDTTITGIGGRMVMFSGLTAPRSVYLPPSTTMMQTIMVMDEDGSCNLTNYITIVCSGADKIEGNPTRILNYPYAALTLEANGNGGWIVVANPNPSLSAGIQIPPTYTDNGNGSITFTSGLYCFFTNTSGIGKIKRFNIAGTTFTLTDNTNQYIVADYNAGSPTIYVTTDVTIINETTIIPVYTIYRRGTLLHILEWDALGDALGNKTHQSIVKTQRFRAEPGGLVLGEAPTRLVTITGGTVWHGAVKNVMAAFNSGVNTMWQANHVAGVWTFTTVTQYNNTQWDDGTNLQTLPGGKYAVNFVYRVVGTNDTTTIVFLGQGAYSLGDAQASQPPANLPAEVLSHAILVGRIIVNQGGATATQIDSAFATLFTPGGVTDHNALLNLQGGAASEYYHLTSAEYTGTGTDVFVRKSAPTFGTGTTTFSDTTASTSTTNGSVVVKGGIGCGGAMNSKTATASPGSVSSSTNCISASGTYTGTTGALAGFFTGSTLSPSAGSTSAVYGLWSTPRTSGSFDASTVAGAVFDAAHGGTTTLSYLYGNVSTLRNTSTGTITRAYGLSVVFANTGGGTITNAYGVSIADVKQTGITNAYALYVATQSAGAYAIYTNGNGLVRIGDTTASTSATTGSVTTLGGLGVAGQGSFGANVNIYTAGFTVGIKEGTNAKMGSVALTAGSATVSTTAVTATSRIFLTSQVDGGTPGFLRVSTRTEGTSFTITSSSATDTSTVAWVILDPL